MVRLRSYIAEPFFAPLSALIFSGELNKKRAGMLERYATLKNQAVKSLCDEIGSVQTVSASERRSRLAAFGGRQADAVAQIEVFAEEIRQDLMKSGLFTPGVDWEATRNWHLGDAGRATPYMDECQVLQAAAYFGPELSREQRGLLQDTAMETLDRGRAAAASAGKAKPEPYLYFTPSTSRIRMPEAMPEAVRQRVATYRNLKDSLKEELRTTVFGQDKSDDRTRIPVYAALREAQAERIAQLETLAEEIRVGLVGCVFPDEPPSSPIPASLAPPIADYLKAKVEAQRAFIAKLAEVQAALPDAQAEIVRSDGGYKIQVREQGGVTAGAERVLATLPEFHDAQARRYAELVAKKKALFQSLDTLGKPLETAGRSVDALLQEFVAAQGQRETWTKYWEYRQAVLEPGMSDGQRRLLFSSAVESLVAPLLR